MRTGSAGPGYSGARLITSGMQGAPNDNSPAGAGLLQKILGSGHPGAENYRRADIMDSISLPFDRSTLIMERCSSYLLVTSVRRAV